MNEKAALGVPQSVAHTKHPGTPGAADAPILSEEDMAEVDAEVQSNLLEGRKDE